MTDLTTHLKWEEVGAWYGGTVTSVALVHDASSTEARNSWGLLASRAGIYCWRQDNGEGNGAGQGQLVVSAFSDGLSDYNVVALALAPGDGSQEATAFAATATGRLFRNRLHGDKPEMSSWEEMSSWAGLGVAFVLAPSPEYSQDQTIFAGTPQGIYRTLDDGYSWESCNFGLLDEEVLCLACAANIGESDLLWAGTANGGLYRSRNRAKAWRESGSGLPDAALQSLAVSPNFAIDRTLYVGMEEHGIYRSVDGGETWQEFALTGLSVNCLVIAENDLLWAGSEEGLWRVATTSGEAEQVTGAGENIMSVSVTATGEVAAGLYGNGLWLTQDGHCASQEIVWQKPQLPLHAPPVVSGRGSELFAFNSDGLLAWSINGGSEWMGFDPPNGGQLLALALLPRESNLPTYPTALFAATETGLSSLRSDGEGWDEVASDFLASHTLSGVAVPPLPGNDERLIVTTQAGRLFLTQDGGVAWREMGGPWHGQTVLRMKFAPDDATQVVALTARLDEANHYGITLWQTSDLGATWNGLADLQSDLPSIALAWPEDSAEKAIFMATQHRLIKFYERGEPPELQIYQHFLDESQQVTALAVAPDYDQQQTIWAATTGGFYRSIDRGQSWQLLAELPQQLPVVWLDVTRTEVTAITLGGQTWRAALS